MPQKIIDEYFYKFFQCPHWLWYDIYGDATKKKKVPKIIDLIYKGKLATEGATLKQFKEFEEINPELTKDVEESFLATLELMKQGKNIYHGTLMDKDWVGMPDLLEARPLRSTQGEPAKSNFGPWEYSVYDIRGSLDLREDVRFQLVFYSLILERLQGVRPREAYVMDPDGNTRSFLVDDFVDQFQLTCEQIEKILDGEKPAPFLKSGCKRTPWYSVCMSDAKDCNDVSLVYRLSQSDQRHLYNVGIKTIDQLAKADINELQAKIEDWPFDKLVRFSNQAKMLVNNETYIIKKPDFPKVQNEIYFDVESDPTRDIYYLLCFLVKSGDAKPEYKYFWANGKEEESKIWKQFLDFLASWDDFVIYHFAPYERQVFDRLKAQYGAPEVLERKFVGNTIDLHMKLVESVVLPLYFYTLKDVAKHIGFNWDAPDAGGAESVTWYNDWLDTKGEDIKLKILRYNEDDVRATLLVKEWLETQRPHTQKESLGE